MSSKLAPATPLLLALALVACGGDNGGGDGGPMPMGCPGNTNVDPTSAADLAEGTTAKGYVCPTGNQHFYRITVPAGHQVVSVDLHNDTPLSPVKLSYELRGSDGAMPIDGSPPPAMGTGRQTLRYSHCVPQPGTYYLQVHAYGDDAQDTRNAFTLSYTTSANPDPNQPADGAAAGAVALTGMDQKGYIACKGQQAFYKIAVGASTLLNIHLTTAVATPNLNLKYTLYDSQMNFQASDAVDTGMHATNLQVIRSTPGADTYYIVVADQGNGSDIQDAYTINVSSLPEPDANDRPVRNDVPAAATPLGAFACGGGVVSLAKTGYLASRADVDWYKVTVSGVGAACPAVVEASASWGGGGQAVRPQISLLYPDMYNTDMTQNTACTKDSDCKLLKHSCSNDTQCEFFGSQCSMTDGKCVGAAVCLPEGYCGVIQYAKQQTDTGTPASVRTAQPLAPSTVYYLRVRDYQSIGYDATTPYSFTVRLGTDDNEPNNVYSPYGGGGPPNTTAYQMKYKIGLGQAVQSAIRYERDQDYWFFDHPCPGTDCTLSVTYSTTGPSPVYFTYTVTADGGKAVASWPAAPAMRMAMAPTVAPTVFGDGVTTCFYASHRFNGPFYVNVADLLNGGPLWDFGTTYKFTVTKVQDGCSALCKNMFGCGN